MLCKPLKGINNFQALYMTLMIGNLLTSCRTLGELYHGLPWICGVVKVSDKSLCREALIGEHREVIAIYYFPWK